MNEIKVVPLGAGQDVGRSCILVSIGGKNIMFDCGMHMGYNNEKRFPDFSYITRSKNVDEYLDCVIISHFHLDHCGALPYFTEMVGYNGPVYMTHPTKAIAPILLEDFRKITIDKRGDHGFFTQEMIHKSMKKVRCVGLQQVVKIDDELEIQPFYAGHVLGAAMFLVRVGKLSVLYTGDYNMTPDRHLGAAWVSRCEPNLLITESTYATTIRDSKRIREREFLENVHNTLLSGGKVLIPVFALGRAQELCIMLETYWDRMNLSFPVYFSSGMVEKANEYYKLFISWTNQKIKETFVERNMFDFKHIKTLPQGAENNNEPMVVFATPGMLHAGQSLNIFKKWAGNEKNMVIIPGYCVAGTVGYKIQSKAKKIEFDKTTIDVRLKVEYLSFSAHADAKGIMDLINQCKPRNVMLVHGEAQKMDFLKARIEQEFKLKCYKPANGEIVTIKCDDRLYCNASRAFIRKCLEHQNSVDDENDIFPRKNKSFKSGIIIKKSTNEVKLMDRQSAISCAGLVEHHLQFTSTVKFISNQTLADIMSHLVHFLKSIFNTESGHEIHCQEESFTIGPLEDPLVTILVKESTLSVAGAGGGGSEDMNASYNSPGDATQIFDVLKVTDKINGSFESLQNTRQVCLHVTYSYQEEPMGSRLYEAIQIACSERRLDFIS